MKTTANTPNAISTFQPGMIVPVQLGNPQDTTWSPAAPVLLVMTNQCFFGAPDFLGVAKKADGTTLFIYNIAECLNGDGTSGGFGYSTKALELRHMYPSEAITAEKALRFHKEKFEALEAYVEQDGRQRN